MNVVPLHAAPARPPAPVLAALALLALVPLRLAWLLAQSLLDGEWFGLTVVPFLALWVLVLRGLWQGGRGAYVVAVVLTALFLLSAIGDTSVDPDSSKDAAGRVADNWPSLGWAVPPAVVLLLLVSRPGRTFYAPR